MFDVFDFRNTGKTTGNMGYGGPGNYFGNTRSLYGAIDQNSRRKLNVQPYLITNIESTPSISSM